MKALLQPYDWRHLVGRPIREVVLEESVLRVSLVDGTDISVSDEGQSCCEHRYLTCDGDDLSYWVGAEFRGIEIRNVSILFDEFEHHEQAFIALLTSRGEQVFAAHNEHNGYYGGFAMVARVRGGGQ